VRRDDLGTTAARCPQRAARQRGDRFTRAEAASEIATSAASPATGTLT
jgi:hypothetical protein